MTAVATPLVRSPDTDVDWHAIDWQKAHHERASAPSAYREGDTGRQMGQGESLATSADPLVQRQSAGRQTSDGKSRQTDSWRGRGDLEHPGEESTGRAARCANGAIAPSRCGGCTSPKADGTEKRPLAIPTMHDRAMQALYLLALDPIAETQADPNSYGFRLDRSTADAIEQCHIVLALRQLGAVDPGRRHPLLLR